MRFYSMITTILLPLFVVGCLEEPEPKGGSSWGGWLSCPLPTCRITLGFGEYFSAYSGYHDAIDLEAAVGTPVTVESIECCK